MDTAKDEAATHLDAEEAETISVSGLKDDAQDAWSDLNDDLAGLEDLYDSAKEIWDGTLATTNTKKEEWDAAT